MNLADLLTAGNIVMLVSNLPSIYRVIKDRSALKGFSLFGNGLTLIGMLLFDIWYLSMGSDYYLPFGISLSTDIYYVLCIIFLLRKKKTYFDDGRPVL
jgi:hypothetical protein